MGTRVVSLELSFGLHAALFLLMMGLPAHAPEPSKPEAKREPIPIEVAFVQTETHHATQTAPGPKHTEVVKQPPQPHPVPHEQKPVPKPPVQMTHHVAPPRHEAPQHHAQPAPHPVNRIVHVPHPDLHALLQQREARRRAAEEAALARLRDRSQQGSPTGGEASHRSAAVSNNGFAGDLSTRSILAKGVARYPEYDRAHEIQGSGRYAVTVNASGGVVQVDVLRSAGSPRLDQAARTMLREYRFTSDPSAGLERGEIEITFELH